MKPPPARKLVFISCDSIWISGSAGIMAFILGKGGRGDKKSYSPSTVSFFFFFLKEVPSIF